MEESKLNLGGVRSINKKRETAKADQAKKAAEMRMRLRKHETAKEKAKDENFKKAKRIVLVSLAVLGLTYSLALGHASMELGERKGMTFERTGKDATAVYPDGVKASTLEDLNHELGEEIENLLGK